MRDLSPIEIIDVSGGLSGGEIYSQLEATVQSGVSIGPITDGRMIIQNGTDAFAVTRRNGSPSSANQQFNLRKISFVGGDAVFESGVAVVTMGDLMELLDQRSDSDFADFADPNYQVVFNSVQSFVGTLSEPLQDEIVQNLDGILSSDNPLESTTFGDKVWLTPHTTLAEGFAQIQTYMDSISGFLPFLSVFTGGIDAFIQVDSADGEAYHVANPDLDIESVDFGLIANLLNIEDGLDDGVLAVRLELIFTLLQQDVIDATLALGDSVEFKDVFAQLAQTTTVVGS